jgi:hypothetical protein
MHILVKISDLAMCNFIPIMFLWGKKLRYRTPVSDPDPEQGADARGCHLKHCSIISITLSYVFALSHNALPLLRSIITFIIYSSGQIGAVIISYSYC